MPADPSKTPTARDAIDRQGLMDDMMERCSVDPLALIGKDGGQSYVEARAKCRACSCVGNCRDWLLIPELVVRAAAVLPQFRSVPWPS